VRAVLLPARLTRATLVALTVAGLTAAASPIVAEGFSTGSSRSAGSAGKSTARAPHKQKRAARAMPLKMIWGPLTLPNGASAFPTYHQLGVQVLEIQLLWARTALTRPGEPTNPADPAYRWPSELDQAVSQAAAYHIAIAVMIKGAPAWANGGHEESWAPTNAADYASFAQAASRRYPSVHYWMIWGESNSENFKPMPPNSPVGPRRYALLLDAAYGALKAVSGSNIVIGGMTWTVGAVKPADFIRWMRLPDGAPPRLDYYGHNPYSTRFPSLSEGPAPEVPVPAELERLTKRGEKLKPRASKRRDINDIDTLHSELAAAYRDRPGGIPKLWLSEFSISSDGPNRAFDFFVSRAEQARWLTAAFKLVDSVPYVAGLGWYELLDESATVPFHLTEGLLAANGSHKPAFSAYAHAR
jgi:hypothetical protein